MAITLSNRREGVHVTGKRQVTYLVTFSDNTADDVSNAELGLHRVDEVLITALTASSIAIDVTANDGTNVTLDPSAAGAHDITFVGY
jgi:beta-lactamase class A